MDETRWPPLPYAQWRESCAGLHLRTQILGKIRLSHTPWLNHSWHVVLQVTARGLTTGPIFFPDRSAQLDLDLLEHRVVIETSRGERRELPLVPQSTEAFYGELLAALAALGLEVSIDPRPSEIPNALPFDQDRAARPYDRNAVRRFHAALLSSYHVLARFRTAFLGKASPVHFFWGSFDLAVTRFSGRTAPAHPGGIPALPDSVAREAYSHEVSSAGFWPGGGGFDEPAYYCYAYPEPAGFAEARIRPDSAFYELKLREFVLPYEAVRTSAAPEDELMAFLESSFEAAARAAAWDTAALVCPPGEPRVPRRCHAPRG